jgi:hypothetical protein
MADHMKTTCSLCPYSKTKTLGLHPDRAEEFAYLAQNPYNDFPCHKTAVYHEPMGYEDEESGYVFGDDFEPDGDGFESTDEMISAHIEIWEKRTGKVWSDE